MAKLFKFKTSEGGYSLSELMTATGMATIVALLLSSITTFAVFRFLSTKDRMEAEAAAARAEYWFRSYLSQAVDISTNEAALTADATGMVVNVGSSTGQIRNILIDQIGDVAASGWMPIATFLRENGGSGLTGSGQDEYGGRPQSTQIWFRRPEAAANTSGVLFFDTGVAGVTAARSPSYSIPFVDRVSYLEIQKMVHNTFNTRVTSVNFRIRFRYHEINGQGTTFCPILDIANGVAGCNPNVLYRDVDKRFTVVLKNNMLKPAGVAGMTGSLLEEHVNGLLYNYRLIVPVAWGF